MANQRKHALRIWIQGCTLNNCNARHTLYSVRSLAHDLSGFVYFPLNLPSPSFALPSFWFAGMLCSLLFHLFCGSVPFIILCFKFKNFTHLEFLLKATPLTSALPAVNSTQCTVWLTTCQVPVIFLLTCLHFLSCSFLFVLLACCLPLPFHFSCLPVSFIILFWPIKNKHALRIWIQGCTLNNCNARHTLYSVRSLAHDLSGFVYFPLNLPSPSFALPSFWFAGMLCSLLFHLFCGSVPFIILCFNFGNFMHLEFLLKATPLTSALPAINSIQWTAWFRFCLSSFQPPFTSVHIPFPFVCWRVVFLSFLSFSPVCSIHIPLLQN